MLTTFLKVLALSNELLKANSFENLKIKIM